MGIFTKKKKDEEKRTEGINYINSSFSDALSFSTIYNKFNSMNISAVYRAVEIISDSIAILPIKLKINKHDNEIENHPLNLIFNSKNYNTLLSTYNLMKLLIQSVMLRGNGFAYIERAQDGSVINLRYIDSNDVIINYDIIKEKLTYTITYFKKRIEPNDMIHLVKNSYDGINGISIITFATRSIKLANNAENSASNFFDNGCNLAGVLTVQGQLNDQQRKDIRNSWNQAYNNGGNGLAVLQGNMEYKPIQLSAKDSQLLESRIFNTQDIARFFGISPVLLGDLSNSSYSTIEATQNQFLLHTLQPYIKMIEEEFNRKLLKPSESDINITLDENYILKTDKTALANYYNSLLQSGVLCVNEVRKELGYGEIEGGDKHIIAYTKIEDNMINKSDKDGE